MRAVPAKLLWLLAIVPIAAFLLWETRGQTLYADEWFFLVHAAADDPRGLLEPDQGNMVFGAVLVYKATLSIAGAGDHLPVRIVWVALDLLCAGLFFALMRARVGAVAAAVPALVLTLFGAAWEMFGGSLGINVLTSMAAGLGALLALDRRSGRADALACLLLAFSVVSHSTGFAFVAWALGAVLLSPDRRRRAWLLAPPLLLYGSWYVWARQFDQSEITLATIASAPAAVVSLLAAATASMSGTFRYPGPSEDGAMDLVILVNEEAGFLLGALLVAAVGWRLARVGLQSRFAPPLLAIAAYWASIALVSPARDPATGRYQYASAILILLLLAELWRGWRPSRPAALAIAAIGAVALVPNAINLHYAAQFVREVGERDRGKLAVVEALGESILPETVIEAPPGHIGADLALPAGEYLDAVERFGSPAYTITELAEAGAAARRAADHELVYLFGIGPPAELAPSGVAAGAGCRTIPPGTIAVGADFALPPGGLSFRAPGGAAVTVGLRRFGDEFQRFGPVAGAPTQHLRIADDEIARPWRAAVESTEPVLVCPLAPA